LFCDLLRNSPAGFFWPGSFRLFLFLLFVKDHSGNKVDHHGKKSPCNGYIKISQASVRLDHSRKFKNPHASHHKFPEVESSVKSSADTSGNTADNKRLFQGKKDTVNSRFRHTKNTGNKVGQSHFFQLFVLCLKEDSQYHSRSCKGTGEEWHHYVVVSVGHNIVDIHRDKSPMQSENNQNLPGQAHNSPCKHWEIGRASCRERGYDGVRSG